MTSQFEGLNLDAMRARRAEVERRIEAHQAEVNTVEQRIKPLQDARSRALNDINHLRQEIREIERKIAYQTTPRAEPTITDHAILRYIERVHEVNVEAIRREIMTDRIRESIRAGASAVKVDGMVYKIANNAVVTIVHDELRPTKAVKLTRAQRERLEDGESQHALVDEDPKFTAIPGGWI